VTEIVGECSFLTVRPYHFERNDTCISGSFVTQEIIPANIANQIYKSSIPHAFAVESQEAVAVPLQPKSQNPQTETFQNPQPGNFLQPGIFSGTPLRFAK